MKDFKARTTHSNRRSLCEQPQMAKLSDREIEILEYISLGYTGQDIADLLFVSKHTVISHRRKLLDKLSATTSASLVRNAFEFGVLQLRAHVA